MSTLASSSSSAERSERARAFESARTGDVIAGFRLERLIGRGETGAVYEATQLSLGRTVALRLIDPAAYADRDARARLDRELGLASSLHHPGLVPIFETGEWTGGRFLAMRLIRAETLDARGRLGGSPGARDAELLEPVVAGLEAAHRAGLSHGAVGAQNVLVDRGGNAHLTDLGLARGAGVEEDHEQLAALRASFGASSSRRGRKALIALAVGIAAIAAVLLVGFGFDGGRGYADEAAPLAPDGTEPLGSGLPPGPAQEVGCGQGLGGASSCTLVPADSRGMALRARQDGVIRTWAVRGAAGELTLQVLRPRGGTTQREGFSQPVQSPDPGPHRFLAGIGVDRGDIVAVKLGPGATLGRRAGGRTLRWAGAGLPLPALSRATPLSGELLIRVDVEPGAKPPVPVQLTGPRAQGAPEGATLAETTVAMAPRRAVQVRLVRLADQILWDAAVGSRRTERVAIPGANPEGELALFEQGCGHPRSVCLRWRNPGAPIPLIHEVRVAPSGRFRVIG